MTQAFEARECVMEAATLLAAERIEIRIVFVAGGGLGRLFLAPDHAVARINAKQTVGRPALIVVAAPESAVPCPLLAVQVLPTAVVDRSVSGTDAVDEVVGNTAAERR